MFVSSEYVDRSVNFLRCVLKCVYSLVELEFYWNNEFHVKNKVAPSASWSKSGDVKIQRRRNWKSTVYAVADVQSRINPFLFTGPVCPQLLPDISNRTIALSKMPLLKYSRLLDMSHLLSNQSEDCLYLNIYLPVLNNAGKQRLHFNCTHSQR